MDKEELANKLSSDEGVEIPVLPLRDVIVYPNVVSPLYVGREKSIKALDDTVASGIKHIFLVSQKDPKVEDPDFQDLYDVGVVANILQLIKLPDGTVKVLVEGSHRATIVEEISESPFFMSRVVGLGSIGESSSSADVLSRTLLSQFEKYIKLNKKVPIEIVSSLKSTSDLERLIDTIAAHVSIRISEKQKLLEIASLKERVDLLIMLIEAEIDLLEIENRIRNNVKKQIEKTQREHFLHVQMSAIKEELGENANDADKIKEKIASLKMPKEAREKAESEINKLEMMPPMSAEATVSRTYLDYLASIPWNKRTKATISLPKAQSVLDEDHWGLEKIKERVLEYLAVQKRVRKIKGPILCFVGPPGVGKTSLGRSLAKAMGRKFVRFALGGVRDEAEIRGHRKTYIGAMPGKIMQKVIKSEVSNPLFLLDEIDKMSADFRGDPASAMLEVLDPEQNFAFNDHYLEVDYDLSDVMFVATANSLNIPAPLLDRMEVIHLSGYTEDEKLNIAKDYLVPKQKKNNGLDEDELQIKQSAILDIVRYYTRESGVRGLEKEISKLCRKVVRKLLDVKEPSAENNGAETNDFSVGSQEIEDYLGVKKYRFGIAEDENRVGQVTGLAWTEVGGDILTIESIVVPGKGKVISTGKLGEVMQESIQAATTVVRARTDLLGISDNFHESFDLHFHVPEGATPKDGPSAGIAMCTALVSSLTKVPVRADVAMTGEITLRGEVLPIGGLKEKLLAARRGGIKLVIIPKENERDLREIPANVKDKLDIRCVKWIDEVLDLALTKQLIPLNLQESSDKLPKNVSKNNESTTVV